MALENFFKYPLKSIDFQDASFSSRMKTFWKPEGWGITKMAMEPPKAILFLLGLIKPP